MREYIITATQTINHTVKITAPDEKSALLQAERLKMGDYDLVGREFTIDYIEESEE